MDEKVSLKPFISRLGRDNQNDPYMCGYTDGWNHCIQQLLELVTKGEIAIS